MGNRKGQKHYPNEIKEKIREEYAKGKSTHELEREYGISRHSVASWCGLRAKVNEQHLHPKKRGRPSAKPEDLESKVRRLEMENELLRNFLQELERK